MTRYTLCSMSQLYPHYKEFHVHNWNMIVYSTETTGAIRRRAENPPVTGGQIPPHAPVEVDGHDPIHPDDHGPPAHDDVEFPDEDVDDSGEQDDYGMNDPPTDPRPVVNRRHFLHILLRQVLLL